MTCSRVTDGNPLRIHEHPHEENRRGFPGGRGADSAGPGPQAGQLDARAGVARAICRYVWQDSNRKIPVEEALPDEIEAIKKGQAQIGRGEYVLLDELKHEMGRPPPIAPRGL